MKITSLLTDSGKISENIATEGSCVVKKEKKISHIVAGKDKGPFSNFFFFLQSSNANFNDKNKNYNKRKRTKMKTKSN